MKAVVDINDPHGKTAWVKFNALWVVLKAEYNPDLACLHKPMPKYLCGSGDEEANTMSHAGIQQGFMAELVFQNSHLHLSLFAQTKHLTNTEML